MDRPFSCYAVYMARSLKKADLSWVKSDACTTVRDFFRRVITQRPRNRFDIHGEGPYSEWAPGDLIKFREQDTETLCAEAVLEGYVAGPHAEGNQDAKGHFFLKDIRIVNAPESGEEEDG